MEILIFPNPKLKKLSTPYDTAKDRDEILKLIDEMPPLMYEANGIGLAAPQLGVNKRLFIIDIDQEVEKDEEGVVLSRSPGNLLIFINPEIISKEGETVCEEGCLSVPGVYEEVKRAQKIKVQYYDKDFNKQELQAEGILAVAIQHENDHLDGILFIDKLPSVKKTLVKNRILKGKNL